MKTGLFASIAGTSKGRKKKSRSSRIPGRKKKMKTYNWPSLSAVFLICFFFASAVNLHDASSISGVSGHGGASFIKTESVNVHSALKLSIDHKAADSFFQFSLEDTAKPSSQSRKEDLTKQSGFRKGARIISSIELVNVSSGGGVGGVRGRGSEGTVEKDTIFQVKRMEVGSSTQGVAMVETCGEGAISGRENTFSGEEEGDDQEEGVGGGNCSCDQQLVKVVAGHGVPEQDEGGSNSL